MSDQQFIVAPLPQLLLPDVLSPRTLHPGFSVRTLSPELRRVLLNKAKDNPASGDDKNAASSDILQLLLHSDTVFTAQVPDCPHLRSESTAAALFYSQIASDVINRIFKCLLLFDWVPAPLYHYCWFILPGTPDTPDLSAPTLLDPAWSYFDTFHNLDWRSADAQRVDIGLPMVGISQYWAQLSSLLQIELLHSTFTDPAKQKGYWAAAEKRRETELEQYMKACFGDDVTVGSPSGDDTPTRHFVDDSKIFFAPTHLALKWTLAGYSTAYRSAIDALSADLQDAPARNRLFRAFQFFTDAFRVPEPHRYVAFSICLESLLCTQHSELTFQLATRAAWLLHPFDLEARQRIYDHVRELYRLRSNIVHGAHYRVSELDASEAQLVQLLRTLFQMLLARENLWGMFTHKDQKRSDAYLDSLNLGGPGNSVPPETQPERG